MGCYDIRLPSARTPRYGRNRWVIARERLLYALRLSKRNTAVMQRKRCTYLLVVFPYVLSTDPEDFHSGTYCLWGVEGLLVTGSVFFWLDFLCLTLR